MGAARHIITATFDWQGIALSVTFEPDWMGISEGTDYAIARLEIEAVAPKRAPLPITETGYRSHFLHPDAVAAEGGPEAYVRAWLGHAAQSEQWRARASAARQLSLF
jgi:hypothetical protein